jgi:hypothetical protein
MSLRAIAAGLVASFVMTVALIGPSAAAGVSVTNRDDKDYKLTIIEGEVKTDHVLKPSQVLEGVCEKGCVIRLNDSENDEYELEGSEIVSIEEGYLYYDSPEPPNEGASGDAGKQQPAPQQQQPAPQKQ